MNKHILSAFAHGKAFIPFVTCGDPSLDVTEDLVRAMTQAGADLIELGIPYGAPAAAGCHRPNGFHDLCQRCLFLRNGAVHENSG